MSVKLATFRGVTIAAPANQLGDALDATKISVSVPGGGGGVIFDGELYADSLSQEPNAGAIDFVIVGARGRCSGCSMTDLLLEWKLGATVAQATVGLFGSTTQEPRSGQLAVDPLGQPWSWANLSALANVGIAFSITVPGSGTGEVDLTEVYVEAWGQMASAGIEVAAIAGAVAADARAADMETAAVSGAISGAGQSGVLSVGARASDAASSGQAEG